MRVRVSSGHLCEAKAPTEAAAEKLSPKVTEGVKTPSVTPTVCHLPLRGRLSDVIIQLPDKP